MLMMSSEQGKRLFLNPTFLAILMLNISATFERDWIKDQEAAPLLT